MATDAQRLVLAIGTTLGVAGMTVALWPSLRATGFRFRWIADYRHEAVRTIVRLATWVVVYVVANQLLYLVVLIMAAEDPGRLHGLRVRVHPVPAPSRDLRGLDLHRAAARDVLAVGRGRRAGLPCDLLAQGIRATAAVLIPASLGYLVLARPIVRLLLEHGETGAASGDLVAEVLVAFAIGLFGFSTFQLLLRASYAMQDSRTPALVNLVAVALHLVVNLVFFSVLGLGVAGLALGHAVAYVFASVAMILLMRRRLGGIDGRRILASMWRVVAAGLLTAGTAWLVAEGFERWLGTASLGAQAIQVLSAVAAGLVVFIASAAALRIEEVDMVRRQVTARWRR